ncbi:MAG: YraN family protein [Lachnospiraceae bacterium]|nr:YraN family protein [Lachnospiraceae bacterium]
MNKRRVGAQYEDLAARCLEEKGYRILERNYRCRQGEIDLIALDGRCLVFVEVKYRRDGRSGDPAEAVNFRKQRRIIRTAAYYCYNKNIGESHPCRFDVVSVLGSEVRHIENAFIYQG